MLRWRLFSVIGKEVLGLHQAAYILAVFALCSQLLALVRDRLLVAEFGAGPVLDVYYTAFRIPDLLFALVASLFSLYALLPILSQFEGAPRGQGTQTISFLRTTLLFFFIGMGVAAGVLWVLAPVVAPLIAPGINPEQLVPLMRILLLQPILLGASNILATLTQLRNRFVLYSVSPLLYNLGIIIGIVFFYPQFGLAGLGWGVVLGAFLHMLIQLPFMFSEQSRESLSMREYLVSFKQIIFLSIPRTLTLSSGQVTLLVLTGLASLATDGSVAVFMLAFNLQSVPLTIIGISYSVAAFPTLARMHASGQSKAFTRHIEGALRHIIFWSVLATVFIVVLRAQIVRMVLGTGQFDWTATRLTAAALALFVLSLLAQSASMLISRAYYAAGNTRKPLFFSLAGVGASIVAALGCLYAYREYGLVRHMLESLLRVEDVPGASVLMLALGYMIGSVISFLWGLYAFSRDFSLSLRSFARLFFDVFAAGLIGGAAAYVCLGVLTLVVDIHTVLGIVVQGGLSGLVGLAVSAAVLALLKNREFFEAVSAAHRRLGAEKEQTMVEPSDIASV